MYTFSNKLCIELAELTTHIITARSAIKVNKIQKEL